MNSNNCGSHLIRKTISTCPFCQKKIDAMILRRGKNVYMEKSCLQHGIMSSLLSNYADYYETMNDLYFNVYKKVFPYKENFLYFTNKCNLSCPICCLSCHQSVEEMSIEEIEDIVKRRKGSRYTLYGAEPTCREDLPDIIRVISKYHKSVNIFTNGLKLADISYVRRLKDANMGMVYLQFDGFKREAYKVLRGRDILDEKIKVLDNLKTLGIHTGLIVVLAKGINDDEMERIIKFAASNDFIKFIIFLTLTSMGSTNSELLQNAISVEELIDILETQSKGRISRSYIYLFQKIFFACFSLFKERSCYFVKPFILLKNKKSYFTLSDILDTKRLEFVFDRYVGLLKKNSSFARVYLIASSFILVFSSFKSIKFALDLVKLKFSCFLRNPKEEKGAMFLPVIFHDGCDRYKLDLQVVKRCDTTIIYKQNGKLHIDESMSSYWNKENL